MSDLIDRQPVITEEVKAADFELNFTLHHPITDEEWDAITDVGLDHTDNIFFHTKNGKEVEFVKRKKGKWIPHEDEDGEHYGDKCSECGEWYVMPYGKTNFCPNCGARMEGLDEQTKN